MTSLSVVVMAAGKGTRMKNPDFPKVMFPVGGKPMIEHVADLTQKLAVRRTVVVVGWHKEVVIRHLAAVAPGVICVEQTPQLGTGHAVMQAEAALAGFHGDVLVLSGDVPLLREETVRGLLDLHRHDHAAASVLTTILDDPAGYGRIIRNREGKVTGIVEQKDATDHQKEIREINSGIYVFRKDQLFEGLKHITPNNAQKEYYLTDVFRYFWKHAHTVSALPCSDPLETRGVNTLHQLEEAEQALAARDRH